MSAFVPFRQFVLKVHSRCDLACDHCYIYEHADQSWRGRPAALSIKTMELAATRIAEHAKGHGLAEVCVVLHGGEPLLAGPEHLSSLIVALRGALGGVCDLDLRLHTNGVLLDTRFCELFREHGVKLGISLDGDRPANDRHRRYSNGRSSHEKVVQAIDLLRTRFPDLYSGLLCTIDVANDPIAVYAALIEHDPPAIDFLLPHATWDRPPVRPSDTAYADWLITIFDRWLADGRPVPVRMFDSIISTSHGGASLTESLGLEPSDLLVVETDGSFEQADSLKTAFDGAPATGMDVFRHSMDDVARYPGIAARQSGIEGLCSTCRSCPVVSSCGGGLFAHRYRSGSGFTNPSVYCPDLLKLIDHVRDRTARPVHAIPAGDLNSIAAGYGGRDAIVGLAEAQRTLSRALIASVQGRNGSPEAWQVLRGVDEKAPDALDAVLAHPYVRVWAIDCLGGQADDGHLAAITIVAAARSGVDARLEVAVRGGFIHLPSVGRYRVAPDAASTTVESRGGELVVAGAEAFEPVRHLTAGPVRVALDDLDPFRDCHEWPAADRLSDELVQAWQTMFQGAWELIERDYADYAPGLAAGLSTIIPLADTGPGRSVSSTARNAFGSVAIALPDDPATLCLLLLHEFQHVKLGAVLDLFDLYDASDDRRYDAPWRDDPRPLEGLLQGTYAHIAVADFWRKRRQAETGKKATEAARLFAHWHGKTAQAIATLEVSGSLTSLGEDFVREMRSTLAAWQDEAVSAVDAALPGAGAPR